MFADDIADRIAIACPDELDGIVRDMWADHTHGRLTENEMEALDEAVRARRKAFSFSPNGSASKTRGVSFWPRCKTPSTTQNAPRASPRPRRAIPRSPDRQRSLKRRRRLSAAGKMPPGLAEQFTVGERAVLYVVAQQVKLRGQCDLYIDQIAAFAGVGRSTTRNALREAKRLNLIQVDERRLRARYNDANRVTIVSPEWRNWLAHGRKETVKNPKPIHQPEYSSRLIERYVSVAKARKGAFEGGAIG
jgi:hypothetical protein